MNISALLMVLLVSYILACIFYVYKLRGRARYPSFSQYLRKSWPVFAPLNCLLYMATDRNARRAVLDAGFLADIGLIRNGWRQIREEALALHMAGDLDITSQWGSPGYYDLGFRTFYKRGWKKFYLQWYGAPHKSAERMCPETVRILRQVRGVRAALFSILPAGAELTLHSDPLACSLRYHLGLATPNSEQCFIDVDGRKLSWRDGEDFVFDETYPHHAKNETDEFRLILMCDVERPMNVVGRAFNYFYSGIARAMTVPNTEEDKRGALSVLFATVAPWRERALRLKISRRRAYVTMKTALNSLLACLALAAVYAVIKLIEQGLNKAI